MILALITRKIARADEDRTYRRNLAREDKLRFQAETLRTISEMFDIADRISQLTQLIVVANKQPETPELEEQLKKFIRERMDEKSNLSVKLNHIMLIGTVPIQISANIFVSKVHPFSAPGVTLIDSTRLYNESIDQRTELIQIVRAEVGVDATSTESAVAVKSPWWSFLSPRRWRRSAD